MSLSGPGPSRARGLVFVGAGAGRLRPGRDTRCRLQRVGHIAGAQEGRGQTYELGECVRRVTGRGRLLGSQTRASSRYREEGGAAGIAAHP